MSALPAPRVGDLNELPEYLPARMVNEYVYCPRLFFYEWVEGVFAPSKDTVAGSIEHARVDKEGKGLPPPEEIPEDLKSRAVTLSSDRHRVIAKLDLVESSGDVVTPVDYKHGRPRELDGAIVPWPADRVQLALQGLVLRENGYKCAEGVIFYCSTRQRVRIAFDDAAMEEAEEAARQAWQTARAGILPPPLQDSPKCVGCSLAPICLPDESSALAGAGAGEAEQIPLFEELAPAPRKPVQGEVRRLVTPRDDLRPVYLDTQGLRVSKSGAVLRVFEKESLRQEIRLNEINQMSVMGNIQLTTQTIQALAEAEIPVCWFSQGGWFYGITNGLSTKNVFLRKAQFKLADEEWFCLKLARQLVAAKVRNHRVMLMRNHVEPPAEVLSEMKRLAERAEKAESMETLLGLEGNGARLYFSCFQGMLKGEEGEETGLNFDFNGRNRRPPRDPVNALLSLAYSMLSKDLTIACYAVGFDPMMGFYHQPRFGRPALALDLMEPFRPLIAESAVLQAVNSKMITPADFIPAGKAVNLTPGGRKTFYRAYELRMDTLVTHPLFGYRVSYRRMLEIQTRLLAKLIEGSIGEYPAFVTR
jgi:CRISPR-associated protein Cas1